MNNDFSFKVFEYKKRAFLFFIQLVLFFPLGFYCFILSFILLNNIANPTVILTFAAILVLTVYYLLIFVLSKFKFINTGSICIYNNNVLLNNNIEKENFNWSAINEIEIFYAGDKFWKSNIQIIQNFKNFLRFNNLNWYIDHKRNFDHITFNSKTYFIKILNDKDKKNLFKLNEIAESKKIKVTFTVLDNKV